MTCGVIYRFTAMIIHKNVSDHLVTHVSRPFAWLVHPELMLSVRIGHAMKAFECFSF
jgi:hypothetical protein